VSTSKILYLFPDTNLLVQCRVLDQLDWERWKDFDEIYLVISRPTQAEIDKHKNLGNVRLAKRARTASSQLRDVILGSTGHKIVRDKGPCVKLLIRNEIRPNEDLKEKLDYSRLDDQLVGIVSSFATANPGVDARVLTHDTGPMASAKMVGVAIAPIPDDWLLAPEKTETDKRLQFLEAELGRYKRHEPEFHIKCVDMAGAKCDRVELETTCYEEISAAELSALTGRLKERFPIATDFGSRDASERKRPTGLLYPGLKEKFTPATDQAITHYREEHANWLTQCETVLRDFHVALQQAETPLSVSIAISNDGTRPAKDALITIVAKGHFQIMPPPYRDEEDEDSDDDAKQQGPKAALPIPPNPPRGTWSVVSPWDIFDRGDPLRRFGAFAKPITPLHVTPIGDVFGSRISITKPRDPNGFYFKPSRPESPGPEFSLECTQWRHGVEPQFFEVHISTDEVRSEVSGALECRVHAENVTDIPTELIPVQIKINRVKTFIVAQTHVECLKRSLLG